MNDSISSFKNTAAIYFQAFNSVDLGFNVNPSCEGHFT